MSTSVEQYFALLRAAIWNHPVEIEGEIDWRAVMKMAEHHATVTLICDVASQMTDDLQPTQKMMGWMKQQMRANFAFHLRLKQTMLMAIKTLREHGIEPVLLKGFSLAQYYPNPDMRQFGDIDLFVGLDYFHESCSLLRGLPGAYSWEEEKEVGRHYNVEFGDYSIEIHRVTSELSDSKQSALYAEMERQGLLLHPQRVDLDGASVTIPSKEFMVFYTFYHAWQHFQTSGVGWRQLCDIALTLHAYHGQLDLDQLAADLSSLHLMKPWRAFGYLMVKWLGLPESEMPFYDASARRSACKVYRYIMEEGNFKRPKITRTFVPKKINTFINILIDFFRMVRVFPALAFNELANSVKDGFGKIINEKKGSGKKIH